MREERERDFVTLASHLLPHASLCFGIRYPHFSLLLLIDLLLKCWLLASAVKQVLLTNRSRKMIRVAILASLLLLASAAQLNTVCPDGSGCAGTRKSLVVWHLNGRLTVTLFHATETCCPIGTRYGCCPYTDGVCCSDQRHCCPNGTTCDLSAGSCIHSQASSAASQSAQDFLALILPQ